MARREVETALNELFDVNEVNVLRKLNEVIAQATTTQAGTVLQAATVAAVASANAGATYTAAEQTLINELKTQVNAIRTALRAAGIMA